eukprot:137872-Pleurochrysis_carterae.AAC.1
MARPSFRRRNSNTMPLGRPTTEPTVSLSQRHFTLSRSAFTIRPHLSLRVTSRPIAPVFATTTTPQASAISRASRTISTSTADLAGLSAGAVCMRSPGEPP